MADFIVASICKDSIPEDAYVTTKSGKKFLNFIIAKRQTESQYGETHCIYLSQTEEERNEKKPKIYIGGGKEKQTHFSQESPAEVAPQQAEIRPQPTVEQPSYQATSTIDDLPF